MPNLDGTIARRAAWVLLTVCWFVGIANTLVEPVNRDEHMYLAAAHLAADHQVYRDFAFFQTPYSVGVYRTLEVLTPGNQVLLKARLFKVGLSALLLTTLFLVLRRMGVQHLLAAMLVALLFQTALVRDMASLARNYDLAQFPILLALLVLPAVDGARHAGWRCFAAGVLAASAVGFKLSYAPLAVLVLAWPLVAGGGRRCAIRIALGAVAGLLPLLWILLDAGVDRFLFNLLRYHYFNAELNALEGYDPHASILGRAGFLLWQLLALHWPLVVLAAVAGVGSWIRRGEGPSGRWVALAWTFVFAGVLIAVVPRPPQKFYLAPLLVGIVLLTGACAARLQKHALDTLTLLCVLAGLLGVVVRGPELGWFARATFDREHWPVAQLHRAGQDLASRVNGSAIATTHPLYALEGGLEIYPGLAAAEFGWRSGRLLAPAERARYAIIAPQDLDALFARSRPAAIVIERDAPWDGPLVAWAMREGWREVASPDPAVVFYLP